MKINTRIFGEVTVSDDKIIHITGGIIGFPDLRDFTIIHNSEKRDGRVAWLVSIQEPAFALPVMDPLVVVPDYNPVVEEEVLKPIGDLAEQDLLVLVTITVPKNPKNISVNLKAPIIINAKERKACQIIIDGDEYAIKFPIYEKLNVLKEGE